MIYSALVFLFWVVFVVFWAVSAVGVKRNIGGRGEAWGTWILIRLALFAAIIVFLSTPILAQFWVSLATWPLFTSTIAKAIGTIFCGAGIAFAIWARVHLGKNWSGRPTMKVDHELVTSGPYRFVRHPIYTGMIVALFGSGLVGGPSWFLIFILASIVFLARIPVEERFMMELFPAQYPEYKKRTKALIPFVL